MNGAATGRAGLRSRCYPRQFGYKGKFYDCDAKKASPGGVDGSGLLLQGAQNAAFADEWVLDIAVAVPVQEGDVCTFQGRPYVVKTVPPAEFLMGHAVAQLITVYRQANETATVGDDPQAALWSAPPTE